MALAAEFVPDQAATEAVEAHVLWMTTGLSCDGDSVAMTSAVNPSLEDLILQTIPGMPKLHIHHPVLAYENGAEFIEWWWRAEKGELDPFVLIVEGSIPNENLSGDGYWAAIGDNPETGQPITTSEWLDRLAPEGRGSRRRGKLRDVRRHPGDEEQPDGRHGRRRPPGLELEVVGRAPRRQHPRLPRTAGQRHRVPALSGDAPRRQSAGAGPRRAAAPAVAVRPHGPRGMQPRRLRRAGPVRHRVRRRPALPGEAGLQGPGGQVQRAGARLGRRLRRLPQRGRHLHGLHDARLPGQVHAVHGSGSVGERWRRTSRSSRSAPRSGTSASGTWTESTTSSPSGASPGTR